MDEWALAARIAVGLVFVAAGVLKLGDRAGFAAAVVDAGVPRRHAGAVAGVLPVVELVCGAGLVVGAFTAAAAAVLLPLTAVFTAAILVALARGRPLRCSCFGSVSRERAGWPAVARNVALLVGLGLVLGAGPPVFALDAWLVGGAPPSGVAASDALAVLIATTAALLAAVVAGRLGPLFPARAS